MRAARAILPTVRAGSSPAASSERAPEQVAGQPDEPEDEQTGAEEEERRTEKRDEHAAQHHRAGDRQGLARRPLGARVAVGWHEHEQREIREHAGGADEREDDEADPEEDRVDVEVAAEAAGDAADDRVRARARELAGLRLGLGRSLQRESGEWCRRSCIKRRPTGLFPPLGMTLTNPESNPESSRAVTNVTKISRKTLQTVPRLTMTVTTMTSDRTQAYGRVVKTLEDLGPAKLQPAEQERIRDAADNLIFAAGFEDAFGRDGRRRGARRAPRRDRALDVRARRPARSRTCSPAGRSRRSLRPPDRPARASLPAQRDAARDGPRRLAGAFRRTSAWS